MTDLDLDRLEALTKSASPLPWVAYDDVRMYVAHRWGNNVATIATMRDIEDSPFGVLSSANRELIVAAVNAVPSLLAAARAVQRVEAALDMLASDTPGEMLVLPPEHHACEREITRLVVVALRAALGGAE